MLFDSPLHIVICFKAMCISKRQLHDVVFRRRQRSRWSRELMKKRWGIRARDSLQQGLTLFHVRFSFRVHCVLQLCGRYNILRIHTESTWCSWHYLLFPLIDGGVFTRPRVFLSSRGQRPPPSWSRSYRVRIRHWSVGRVLFHFSVHTCKDSSFFQFSKWLLHHLCIVSSFCWAIIWLTRIHRNILCYSQQTLRHYATSFILLNLFWVRSEREQFQAVRCMTITIEGY